MMSVRDKVRGVTKLRAKFFATYGFQLVSHRSGMKINQEVAAPVARLMRMRLVTQIIEKIDQPDHL